MPGRERLSTSAWPRLAETRGQVVANGRFGYHWRGIGRIFAALLGRDGGLKGAQRSFGEQATGMTRSNFAPLRAALLLGGLAVTVVGCQSGMTYGTGKSPGMQTVEDIVGLSVMSSATKEPIEYKPRPPIVAPPTVASLPPPVDPNTTSSMVAANWPVDPDVQTQQIRDEIARREAAGEPLPDFRLPAGSAPEPIEAITDRPMTRAEIDEVRRRFADARGAVAVDASGNPVRRYLTDPPVEYRAPDPAAPVELADLPKKKRKFLWWSWGGE